MIVVENIKVYNIARAVFSARNAMDSWAKSDSDIENDILGPNDLDLARRLYKSGVPHEKYLRQIFVTMDITAPIYWWKEESQYKIGTTTNSCSTMHTIHKKPFTRNNFSCEHLNSRSLNALDVTISNLNDCREEYIKTKNKDDWWQLIQILPMSFNQKRTLTMSYENVFNMIRQRTGHKLDEWNEFVEILKGLPYVKKIME